MLKLASFVIAVFIFVFSLSGCASMQKEKNMEIQGLKNQVSLLESQVQSKDEEINALRESLDRAEQGAGSGLALKQKKRVIPEAKSHPSVKQIQAALKNAGYNPGSLDGKMGRQTKDAIRAFQRANDLQADGRVGRKTWDLLKEYLHKKVK